MFHVEQTKNLVEVAECPICGEKSRSQILSCVDHTVSGATFSIVECSGCQFAFTSPRPAESDLGSYYESEEYISHSNTKKGLVSRLYQSVRKYTLGKKLGMVNRLSGKKGLLLDIGCGTGEFLNICKVDGWETIGIEPSPSARKQAQENYGLDVREESALDQLEKTSADVITMWHVMEHVPHLRERVARLKELLKKDGTLIVAVPNRTSYDAAYYGPDWAAYDVPRHLWHFRPQDMRKLMEQFGFEVKQVQPMKFDSYYVSILSEKYRTGLNRLVPAAWRGWISNRKAGAEGWSSLIYIIRHKA